MKDKRRPILFRPLTVKLLTSVLLLFQHCIKVGNFQSLSEAGGYRFSGDQVALMKIGFYFGIFGFACEPKRSEGDREKCRVVDGLPNGKEIN